MNSHLGSSWISSIMTGVLTWIFLASLAATTAAQDQSDATAIVADQVRRQGFPCDEPSTAERIADESSPNQTVYLLKCKATTFRVVLIPDQAAVVTKIE